ncbi:MAG: type secretion system protein [Acidobacteriales bacterium]|nr:type secretion system protein [Terriglobales bacterium]
MEFTVTLVLFVAVFTTIFAFGAATLAPASALGLRLRSLAGKRSQAEEKPAMQERIEHALDPIARALPKSPAEVSRTRGLLIQAGYREARHSTVYFGLRGFLGLAGLIWVLMTGIWIHHMIFLIVVPALGYFIPRFVLKRMVKTRQRNIKLGLPDGLDLAVISVEAGLGLDQALQRVGQDLQHVHPQLSEEFGLMNLELRAGKPRPEALRNLALRTGVDDVRVLVAVLLQTDRFGTSISQALRVHSDALRTERRQRAEEAAAKTTIKMIPVLVFFVFPAMFVVALGPALIHMYRVLLPVVQK